MGVFGGMIGLLYIWNGREEMGWEIRDCGDIVGILIMFGMRWKDRLLE